MNRLAFCILALGSSFAFAQETVSSTVLTGLLSPTKENPSVQNKSKGVVAVEFLTRRDAAGTLLSAKVDFRLDFNLADATNFTAAHIHKADAGVNGPVVLDTGHRGTVAAAAGSGFAMYQVDVTDAAQLKVVSDILANPAGHYFNIHSQTNPGGLMRGQLSVDGAAANLAVVTANGAKLDGLNTKLDQLKTLESILRQIAFRLGISLTN
ncbi:MAG: CHRD domain-containing protein [Bryobacteraceae bacterium]